MLQTKLHVPRPGVSLVPRARLEGAVESYNSAVGCLESRVQVSARRMAELGVGGSGELPEPTEVDRRPRTPRTDPAAPGPGA